MERSALYRSNVYVLIIVLIGLQNIMNTSGSEKLNQFLMDFSIMLQKHCGKEDLLFQIDENKFAIAGISNNAEAYCNELIVSLQSQILNREILHNVSHISYLRTDFFVVDKQDYDRSVKLVEKIERKAVEIEKEFKSIVSSSMHSLKLLQIRKEIYTHPEYNWSTEYCVGFVNFSRSYLHRIYTKLFDCSIADDIKNSRLSYAKYLLVTTDNTLQIIAKKCGFDYFNFMRLFKKEMGITPTEYRKMKCLK